jgi:hypothetical protein
MATATPITIKRSGPFHGYFLSVHDSEKSQETRLHSIVTGGRQSIRLSPQIHAFGARESRPRLFSPGEMQVSAALFLPLI